MAYVRISRMRVTGGFLADLDVTFSPGLNVIIGARGAGKTSLLELIRHALGTPHADRSRAEADSRRIRSLLGNGEVVLDLESDAESFRLVVDADGGGRRSEVADVGLMLGQNELEGIASDAESRLRLVDLRANLEPRETDATDVGLLTVEMFDKRAEISVLEERSRQRPSLQADLEALEIEEREVLSRVSEEAHSKKEQLQQIESELLTVQTNTVQADIALTLAEGIESSRVHLVAELERLSTLPMDPSDRRAVAAPIGEAVEHARRMADSLRAAAESLAESQERRSARELELRSLAEPLRANLEDAERGLGELTARTRNLRAQLARLDDDQTKLHELRQRYGLLRTTRERLLDGIESDSETRYKDRLAVASQVSQRLSARVTVSIEHLADAKVFREFLLSSLQGSGLRYAAIADSVSKRLLPRQLLNYVENGDVESAAAATELAEDRVARVLDHFNESKTLAGLASIQLDDLANFLLTDGVTVKSVDELSTGQKCAVTLPILLTEHRRSLILDQPEDHLDNAFLVDNIIDGLNNRKALDAQTIVATHNANIPVLGSAEKVYLLESDGRRGYVSRAGSFDNPHVVEAITSLMEGGHEAFRRRAVFYETHRIVS